MTLESLLETVKNMDAAVVAIDGPSGSGKSTLADAWKTTLNCTVFHTDDYFLPAHRKTPERLAQPGGNLDVERMIEEIFDHLADSSITSHHYNCTLERLEERSAVKRNPIIVIEGVYSMLPVLQPYYDFTVYLDVDQTTQQERILNRSNPAMLERFLNEWIPLEQQYFDTFDIKKRATVVHRFIQK